MARKLFLAIALFLLVGELTGEMADEDGIILSELLPAVELGASEALEREKRGFKSRFRKKFKKLMKKLKKKLRKKPKPEEENGDQGGGEQGGGEGGEEPQQ